MCNDIKIPLGRLPDNIASAALDQAKIEIGRFEYTRSVLNVGGGLEFHLPGKCPNWFHRFWQRLLLGFEWRKQEKGD